MNVGWNRSGNGNHDGNNADNSNCYNGVVNYGDDHGDGVYSNDNDADDDHGKTDEGVGKKDDVWGDNVGNVADENDVLIEEWYCW